MAVRHHGHSRQCQFDHVTDGFSSKAGDGRAVLGPADPGAPASDDGALDLVLHFVSRAANGIVAAPVHNYSESHFVVGVDHSDVAVDLLDADNSVDVDTENPDVTSYPAVAGLDLLGGCDSPAWQFPLSHSDTGSVTLRPLYSNFDAGSKLLGLVGTDLPLDPPGCLRGGIVAGFPGSVAENVETYPHGSADTEAAKRLADSVDSHLVVGCVGCEIETDLPGSVDADVEIDLLGAAGTKVAHRLPGSVGTEVVTGILGSVDSGVENDLPGSVGTKVAMKLPGSVCNQIEHELLGSVGIEADTELPGSFDTEVVHGLPDSVGSEAAHGLLGFVGIAFDDGRPNSVEYEHRAVVAAVVVRSILGDWQLFVHSTAVERNLTNLGRTIPTSYCQPVSEHPRDR